MLSNAELERLFTVLRTFRDDGWSVIYVSHRLDEVLAICDRITVLKDGERVGTVNAADVDEAELIRMMVGRPLHEIYPTRAPRKAIEELLAIDGLTGPGFGTWTSGWVVVRSWVCSALSGRGARSWPERSSGRRLSLAGR